jgi:hypothetical protein
MCAIGSDSSRQKSSIAPRLTQFGEGGEKGVLKRSAGFDGYGDDTWRDITGGGMCTKSISAIQTSACQKSSIAP